MLKFINLITNNYFLKQKLKVTGQSSPVRRLTDNWQGQSEIGKKIISGKTNPKLIKDFNKFNFLRDLKAEGSIKSRSIARSLVSNWIDERHNLLSKEFDSQIMAERITCWSFNFSWFAESGELDLQKKILYSIALQIKYLEIKLTETNNHLEKIIIIKGILVAKSILFDDIINIDELLNLIDEKLEILTNVDGGHSSRSPVLQINLLRHLIEIRSVVGILKNVHAENLHKQTIKMGEFCRSFQMPNGHFAWFHGGSLVPKDIIKQTLNRVGYKNRIFQVAEDTGFCRLSNMDSLVFVDIGLKPIVNTNTKASLFAFEFFYKKEKIISNLGELINSNIKSAKNSLASSAAHSTLNIDDRNNIDLTGKRKTEILNVKYGKTKDGNLLDITHSGYNTIFGINHKRQIYLSNKKNEIRGKDEIINLGNIGTIPKRANIHFHLDPNIELIQTRSGSILLKHSKGFVWKMSSDNQDIDIKDSVMFTPKGPVPCKEIMINMKLEKIRAYKFISCNWAFQLQK
ncbi:MAG: heparinase II/III family protein [Candidatus Puniceispirillales bacterium]